MSIAFIVYEAVHSTALSHPENHNCRVCRAANGDHDAFAEIMATVMDRLGEVHRGESATDRPNATE